MSIQLEYPFKENSTAFVLRQSKSIYQGNIINIGKSYFRVWFIDPMDLNDNKDENLETIGFKNKEELIKIFGKSIVMIVSIEDIDPISCDYRLIYDNCIYNDFCPCKKGDVCGLGEVKK